MGKKVKPIDNPKEFGARLRNARKRAGYTQSEVASILGEALTQGNLSGYERGDWEPPLAVLADLARLYQVSVDHLLLGADQPLESQLVVHLPRGDPSPVNREQQHLLERALVVLRAKGATGHYAESLTNNINSFYKAIQDTNRLMAGSPGKKAVGDS